MVSIFGQLRRFLPVLLGLALFGLGVFALDRLLHSVDADAVVQNMRATSPMQLALAMGATMVGYLALVGYDVLALKFIGKTLPRRVVILAGMLGYAFGNTIGISFLSGGAVRYRIYSAFGLNAFDVANVSAYIALALGTALTLIGFAGVVVFPDAVAHLVPYGPDVVRFGALGLLIVGVAVIYHAAGDNRKLRIWRYALRLPSRRILGQQVIVSLFDVLAAAFTLWVLMPQGTPGFGAFVAVYAIATMVGVISHVPGGIGVFETVVIATLPPEVRAADAAAALVLFRVIYYLLPFVLGFVVVSINEARLAGGALGRLAGRIPAASRPALDAVHGIAPSVAALATFGFGVYLLMVSILPSVRAEATEDGDILAALLIEGGTLLSAMVGVVLLVLSHGLMRRIKAAFLLTLSALLLGSVAALLNGWDIKSALILLGGGLLLLPFRRGFRREAKLTEGVFSLAWFALVLGVIFAALGFFFLAHRATPYSNDLWTEIAHGANTPRALRAGLVATALMLVFMLFLALRPARHRSATMQSRGGIETVQTVLAGVDRPQACLALSGDKQFLFSPSGETFLMYGVRGSRWVALGDPVGNPAEAGDLCWAFIDLVQRANGQPVFYEVSNDNLPLFVELGLGLHKVGEEAVVDLARFSLAAASFKSMRAAHNKRHREGLRVEILAPPHSVRLMDDLERISDAWLRGKAGKEKGFSIGRFNRDYLNRFSIAMVRRDGRTIAFANILAPGDGASIATDLMRYAPGEVPGIMEFLFLSLIEHYQKTGAREFSLGVVPPAGLSERSVERVWSRFGRFIYRNGGAFDNFAELRTFKASFEPDWRPRYIAVPPGVSPTRAMADVALLIAGDARDLIRT